MIPYWVVEGLEKLGEVNPETPVLLVPSIRKISLNRFSYLTLAAPMYLMLMSNLLVLSEELGEGRVMSSRVIQWRPVVIVPMLISLTLIKPFTLSASAKIQVGAYLLEMLTKLSESWQGI